MVKRTVQSEQKRRAAEKRRLRAQDRFVDDGEHAHVFNLKAFEKQRAAAQKG